MKISVLHPSRNRAATAEATLTEWLGQASGLHSVEYILSIDTSDGQQAEYARLAERQGVRLLVQPNRTLVQACNRAARVATGDLLIMVSDDIGCPPGWDDALARAVGDRTDAAVLVDDGLGAGTMALPVVGRGFYQSRGYLLFPGYIHLFSGDDLERRARRLGKLLDATHLRFPHRHYSTGASAYDATYRQADRSWSQGAYLLRKREARDFGLRRRTLGELATCARLDLASHWVGIQRLFRRVNAGFPLGLIRAVLRKSARQAKEHSRRLGRSLRQFRRGQNRPIPETAGPSRLLGHHCYVRSGRVQGDVALWAHAAMPSHIVSLRDCVIDRSRVRGRLGGGETPGQSIPEEWAYAAFEQGALRLRTLGGLKPSRLRGYQQRFLASAELRENPRPDQEEPIPTFAVERREYFNIYHTLTELFNAYVAIRLLAPTKPFHLLFLDGHCQGPLDALWSDILQPARILRLHDYPGETTRFRELVLVPDGYESPLWRAGEFDPPRGENYLSDFIATVLSAYQVGDQPARDRVLTFVDRRDYRANAQSDGTVDRKVEDLGHTVDLLRKLYPLHRIDIRGFETMTFGEQLRAVRASDVLCGVHGAALCHVLFLRPGSQLVEFAPPAYRRNDIFRNLAALQSIRYTNYQARTARMLPKGKLVVSLTDKPA